MRIKTSVYAGLLWIVPVLCTGCEEPQKTQKALVQAQHDKQAAPAKLTTAQFQLEQGQIVEARKSIQTVLSVEPDNAYAHCLLGRIELAEGRNADAKNAFVMASTLNDALAEPWYGQGVVARVGGDPNAAMDCFMKAHQRESTNVEYSLAAADALDAFGRTEQAQAFLDQQIKAFPNETKFLCAAASLANRIGDNEKSLTLYRRAISIKPQDTDILQSLATMYVASNDWASAAEIYGKLLLLADDKQKENVLQWLSLCSLNAGQYRKALDAYDKLSVFRRTDPEVWLGMAQASMGLSDFKRARYCAQKTLSLQPDSSHALVVMGCCDYLNRKYLTALESFNQLSGDEKLGGFAGFMAGRCYLKLGRTAQARAAFDKAAKLTPDSPLVSMFLNEANP